MNEPPVCIFSDDRVFRYTLWRNLDPAEMFPVVTPQSGYIQFIGLNPSTADEKKNDRTISKLMGFATKWGFSKMLMTNLFAYRATDPAIMKKHPLSKQPIGTDNYRHVVENAKKAARVVCCWGNDGQHLNQGGVMRAALAAAGVSLQCFKVTNIGEPQHPLYLKNSTELIPYP
jgi:hypothetical protein